MRNFMRSLLERFILKVIAIEECKDLDAIKNEELVGSLQIYELSTTQSKGRKKKSLAIKIFKEAYLNTLMVKFLRMRSLLALLENFNSWGILRDLLRSLKGNQVHLGNIKEKRMMLKMLGRSLIGVMSAGVLFMLNLSAQVIRKPQVKLWKLLWLMTSLVSIIKGEFQSYWVENYMAFTSVVNSESLEDIEKFDSS